MPQLTSVTFHSGTSWYFRWPYHAKVMKMFEISSRTMVSMYVSVLSNSQIGGGFQRRAADAADYGGAVAADQRVSDFAGAVGAIERIRPLLEIFLLCHAWECIIKLLRSEEH